MSMILAGVSMGAFLFFANRVGVFHDRAVAVHNTVALADQKTRTVDVQRRVLRQLDQSGINLTQYFFAEGDALSAIELIEHAGMAQGVRVSTSTVDTVVEKRAPLGAYMVTVNAEGSFEALVHFLESIQSLPYALRIHTYSLELVQGESQTYWHATISIAGAYVVASYATSPTL